MFFRHHMDYCVSDRLGVDKPVTESLAMRLQPAFEALKARHNPQAAALLNLPFRTDDLPAITALAADIRARFSHVIVAGAGGSGLSGRVLALTKPVTLAPKIHFLETIDPDAIADTLAQVSLPTCCFIVISKSGSTVETLAHFYVLLEQAARANGGVVPAGHFIVITTKGASPLRDAAQLHGMHIIDHDDAIGGRFSIFTEVGLLPGAIAGVDIAAIRKGAAAIVTSMDEATIATACAPAMGAALQHAHATKGRSISVMLPYCERLSGFSSWYRQSWAESLAKDGKGTTPIRAIGTTDQHSQLQLYLDGPKDKLFHLITVARAGTGQKVVFPPRDDLAYLAGKTTGDIMEAEQQATLETLARNGCPVRWFEMDRIGEIETGALLMHFMLEILFMAALLEVNPFDQPAVEEGKRLARDYLLAGNV